MTLYADLVQTVGTLDATPGSIAIKQKKFVYATVKDGSTRIERYLGLAADPEVLQRAADIRQAAQQAKAQRSTVTLLKNARVPAPSLVLGRILEVLANAGLFKRGMTLIGTAAYQTYSGGLGAYLPNPTLMTNDVDLSVAEFITSGKVEDIEAILKRADPTFKPHWGAEDKLPKRYRSSNGFSVDILTKFGRGRTTPVQIESLMCAAEALSFQEYPVEDTMETVALYGSGVLVRVPTPVKFAVHKLIVAYRRNTQSKQVKDLQQANALIDILLETDENTLVDELDGARSRGKAWKTAINASLERLGRDTRPGVLPIVKTKRRKAIPKANP